MAYLRSDWSTPKCRCADSNAFDRCSSWSCKCIHLSYQITLICTASDLCGAKRELPMCACHWAVRARTWQVMTTHWDDIKGTKQRCTLQIRCYVTRSPSSNCNSNKNRSKWSMILHWLAKYVTWSDRDRQMGEWVREGREEEKSMKSIDLKVSIHDFINVQ